MVKNIKKVGLSKPHPNACFGYHTGQVISVIALAITLLQEQQASCRHQRQEQELQQASCRHQLVQQQA